MRALCPLGAVTVTEPLQLSFRARPKVLVGLRRELQEFLQAVVDQALVDSVKLAGKLPVTGVSTGALSARCPCRATGT